LPEQICEAGLEELLFDPADRPLVDDHWKRLAMAKDGETIECEFVVRRADDQWRWLRCRDTVLSRGPDGSATQSLGTAEDVTDQRRANEQLQTLNESLQLRATQLRALAAELGLAEQRERRRLAELLHDHLQQLLYAARLSVFRLHRRAEDPASRQALEEVEDLLSRSIEASRSLTADLSPPVLYERGLAAGLHWLAQQMQQRHGLQVELSVDPEANPQAEDAAILLFQAVRELLFNVVKHAKTDRARVDMICLDPNYVEIVVSDAGVGFDPAGLETARIAAGSFGLFSLQQRLTMIGGRMDIDAAPGQGVRTTLVAPRTKADVVTPQADSAPTAFP
jgi:signal transduction histidine kinase